jgi:hypothetical protein
MPDTSFFLPPAVIEAEARRQGVPAYKLLDHRVAEQVIMVNGAGEVADMSYRMGGRAVRPVQDVVLYGPHGEAIILPGFGVTEMAELQDLAAAVYEREAKRPRSVDFEEMRARDGLPSAADFSDRFKQGLRDTAKRLRGNSRTSREGLPVRERMVW